jgi:hypothetical protein
MAGDPFEVGEEVEEYDTGQDLALVPIEGRASFGPNTKVKILP